MEIRYPVGYRYKEGGPGSGNFGHAGRPGMRGGSAPKGGGAWSPVIEQKEQEIINAPIEHGIVVAEDGTVLVETSGRSNSIKFTWEETSKMKGAILTHNHPNGTTFSGADVQLALSNNVAALRAVGVRDGRKLRYILKLGPQVREMSSNQVFKKYIGPIEESLMTRTIEQIHTNQITLKEANRDHAHKLWTEVSQAMAVDGLVFDYSQRDW